MLAIWKLKLNRSSRPSFCFRPWQKGHCHNINRTGEVEVVKLKKQGLSFQSFPFIALWCLALLTTGLCAQGRCGESFPVKVDFRRDNSSIPIKTLVLNRTRESHSADGHLSSVPGQVLDQTHRNDNKN